MRKKGDKGAPTSDQIKKLKNKINTNSCVEKRRFMPNILHDCTVLQTQFKKQWVCF